MCGHATIATGVALGERVGLGAFRLNTAVGTVVVEVDAAADGTMRATLTSVEPETRPLPNDLLAAALDACGWSTVVLDPAIPPGLAYAGAWHMVVPFASRERLAGLTYDFERLRTLATCWSRSRSPVASACPGSRRRSRTERRSPRGR